NRMVAPRSYPRQGSVLPGHSETFGRSPLGSPKWLPPIHWLSLLPCFCSSLWQWSPGSPLAVPPASVRCGRYARSRCIRSLCNNRTMNSDRSHRCARLILGLVMIAFGMPVLPQADESLEVIVVTGRLRGPPLWRVFSGDHVMYIFPRLPVVPEGMDWDSER